MDELVNKIGQLDNDSKALKIEVDLRQAEASNRIVAATREAFGESIDILVGNAGCELLRSLGSNSPEDFSYVYDLNVRAISCMSKAVSKYLRSPGRIINVSSVGAQSGFKDLPPYCSSKAAVEVLIRCLAAELGPKGHTVNAIESGPV